jgi:PST family polysaccharide transporter/lipopolysaccharide exporter
MLVILARLLSPAAFGLIGIALLTLAIFEQFTEFGFDAALIQRTETNVDRYLNTVWSVQLMRGALLAGGIFLLAGPTARFFGEPRATPILQVMALSPLLFGFRNPGVVYLQKNLEFHKQFVLVMSESVAMFVVAVTTALALQSVWAIVYGTLAGKVADVLASYVVHGHRPWPELDPELARELFTFGKWILGSSVLVFLIAQGDDAFVGWLLSASALGFYQLAYRYSNAPATEVTHVISSVVFPTYSQLQDDIEQLRAGYLKTLQFVSLVSFPVAIGILLVTDPFVRVFLGSKWTPIIVVMQILALWGLIRSIGATTGPLFKAINRPDYETKLQLLKLVLIAIAIYPATATYGIEGTALVIIGSAFLPMPLSLWIVSKEIGSSLLTVLHQFLYPTVGCVIMALSVTIIRNWLALESSLVAFFLIILAGSVSYSVALLAFEWWVGFGLRSLIATVRSSLAT